MNGMLNHFSYHETSKSWLVAVFKNLLPMILVTVVTDGSFSMTLVTLVIFGSVSITTSFTTGLVSVCISLYSVITWSPFTTTPSTFGPVVITWEPWIIGPVSITSIWGPRIRRQICKNYYSFISLMQFYCCTWLSALGFPTIDPLKYR